MRNRQLEIAEAANLVRPGDSGAVLLRVADALKDSTAPLAAVVLKTAHTFLVGGWRSDEARWTEAQDAMIDRMVRLEKALKPQIAILKPEFS